MATDILPEDLTFLASRFECIEREEWLSCGPMTFNLSGHLAWVSLALGWDTCLPVAADNALHYRDDRLWGTDGSLMRIYEPSRDDVLHLINHGIWALSRQLNGIEMALKGIRYTPWEEVWPIVDEVSSMHGLVVGDEVLRCQRMNSWDTGPRKLYVAAGTSLVDKEQWHAVIYGHVICVHKKLDARRAMMLRSHNRLVEMRDALTERWGTSAAPTDQLSLL